MDQFHWFVVCFEQGTDRQQRYRYVLGTDKEDARHNFKAQHKRDNVHVTHVFERP